MRDYLIHIYLHDGTHGRCRGQFANGWEAIDAMTSAFFDAQSIRVRRISE